MINEAATIVEPNLRSKSIFRHYNIGIHAHVSTGSAVQQHSLGTQVSAFILRLITIRVFALTIV